MKQILSLYKQASLALKIALLIYAVGMTLYLFSPRDTPIVLPEDSSLVKLSLTEAKAISLSALVQSLDRNNKDMADQLQALRIQKEHVRYITRVEAAILPEIKTISYPEPPGEHLYRTSFGMPLARFSVDDGSYTFETYQLNFRQSSALLEDTVSVVLTVSSSGEPDVWHSVDAIVNHYDTSTKPFIPVLQLGAVAVAPSMSIRPALAVALYNSNKGYKAGTLLLAADKTAVYTGIQPISLNLKRITPYLKDTWVGLNVGVDSDYKYSFGLMVSTDL